MFVFFILIIVILAVFFRYANSSIKNSNSQIDSPPNQVIKPRPRFEIPDTWEVCRTFSSSHAVSVFEALGSNGVKYAVKEALCGLFHLYPDPDWISERKHELKTEISLLSRLEHKHIIYYVGHKKIKDKRNWKKKTLYLFYEFMSGGSIRDLYLKEGPLDEERIANYTRQILKALKHLHKKNIVHRDVNCSNILLDGKGVVKLAGFHAAEEIDETTFAARRKEVSELTRWAAPETLIREERFGTGSDIWSLGCTVLEMVTAEYPYSNVDWIYEVHELLFDRRPPVMPKTFSEDLKDFIESCLQPQMSDRPTASQLLRHSFVLRGTLNGSPGSTALSPSSPLNLTLSLSLS